MTDHMADILVPVIVATIAAVPATLTVLVTIRQARGENVADHGRVRDRLEELTATVAGAEATNMAAHERLAGEVARVAGRFEAHASEEEGLHSRLEMWLLRQDA